MKSLVVQVDGSGLESQRFTVNTLEAGIEKRDQIEAGWRDEGYRRDGFNPVRLVKGEEWRRAVIVKGEQR